MSTLKDIVVVDFTEADWGQICTEYFALVGMKVIRIDAPLADAGVQPDKREFIANNLSKECITLDVCSDAGRELLQKLIDKADVFVENRGCKAMEELGFGYETVKARNPGLIYTSLRPYAKGSPWEDCPAGEMVIEAVSGPMYLNGSNDREPLMPGVNMPDTSTCVYAGCAIVAALYQRESSGVGQYIEVAQQDSMIAHSRSAYEVYHNTGKNTRSGNSFATMPGMVPTGVYATKGDTDKADANYIQMGASSDKNYKALCTVLGVPELAEDPKYLTAEGRTKYAAELDPIFDEIAAKYTKYELMEKVLLQGRIPSGAVNSMEDLINDEGLRRNGTMQKVSDPEVGDMWLPTFPAIYSGLEIKAENPQSSDAYNEKIYTEFLGLSKEEYETLRADKVI